MTTRIFINGFGRIGRSVLRAILQQSRDVEVVGINDIADLATCAYLFEFDSIYGPLGQSVDVLNEELLINGKGYRFHSVNDLQSLNLSGVDVVLECTGAAETRAQVERGIFAGAGKVLMSGPSAVADATVVMGANDYVLTSDMCVVSNASCTTNALAPILKVLDDAYQVVSGTMTTIHCYTGSQPTVDKPRNALERSRAASLSMVPTSTSAGALIGEVLPHLAGKVMCTSVRVPTASVSAIDLTVQVERPLDALKVNAMIEDHVGPVIGLTHKPVVSVDLRSRPESYIHAAPETYVTDGGLLRVFGWYDNEWGFANRMLDQAERMARL